jgi:hypothetical protein
VEICLGKKLMVSNKDDNPYIYKRKITIVYGSLRRNEFFFLNMHFKRCAFYFGQPRLKKQPASSLIESICQEHTLHSQLSSPLKILK